LPNYGYWPVSTGSHQVPAADSSTTLNDGSVFPRLFSRREVHGPFGLSAM
jgi:hypothetical protein